MSISLLITVTPVRDEDEINIARLEGDALRGECRVLSRHRRSNSVTTLREVYLGDMLPGREATERAIVEEVLRAVAPMPVDVAVVTLDFAPRVYVEAPRPVVKS